MDHLPIIALVLTYLVACTPNSGSSSWVDDAAVVNDNRTRSGEIDTSDDLVEADSSPQLCQLEEPQEFESGACPEVPEFFPGIDPETFSPMPVASGIELSEIDLDPTVTYVEWRFCQEGDSQCQVWSSAGEKCVAAKDKDACIAEFDALPMPTYGMNPGCDPMWCHHHFAVNRGNENFTVPDGGTLKEVLGSVDSEVEAALRVYLSGYRYSTKNSLHGGIRAVDDGWEVIVMKWTSPCLPVVEYRYLLLVTPDSGIIPKCSQIGTVDCGSCV